MFPKHVPKLTIHLYYKLIQIFCQDIHIKLYILHKRQAQKNVNTNSNTSRLIYM